MQLRELAERVLLGDTLDDKLARPRALDDDAPGPPLRAPPLPGRPEALRLDQGRPTVRFPGPGALADPEQRGRMLHFFANHELMALELMALVLLRFPDAPPAWRRGLAGTLADEQRHLSLYIQRMGELGVPFGALPVNRFFWDHLREVPSPRAFAASMALVFEQANLDHCLHYARLCRSHGDEDTAALLDRVLADELRHVRHGLRWFRRWTPEAVSLWDAWTAELRAPLTPERAKGVTFSAALRRQAGLDEDFVRRLALSGGSRGRPPVLRWFTSALEGAWEAPGAAPSRAERAADRDLSLLPLALSGRDDLVLLPDAPRPALLEGLLAAGFELPERLIAPPERAAEALSGRRLGGVEPWGWTAPMAEGLAPLLALVGGAGQRPTPAPVALADKREAARALRELLAATPDRDRLIADEALPVEVSAVHEVEAALGRGGRWVLKRPLGTAGRGARRLEGGLSEADRAWIDRSLARSASLRLEPWLDAVADLSLHFTVGDGRARLDGLTRFFTRPGGRYLASLIGPLAPGLPPEARRFISGDGRDRRWLERLTAALGQVVARRAQHAGYAGPVSADALLVRQGEGLALHPLLELNPRVTMGRVALALGARLAPHRAGLFVVLARAERVEAGAGSFEDLARRWPRARRGPEGLAEGVLPLGDPSRAAALLPALAVGADAAACWSQVGISAPA